MFLLSFARVIKFSLQDIYRNIWLSIVTITILILALFTVNILLVVQVIGQNAINAVKEKIDISLYLSADSSEDKIYDLKNKLGDMPQVKDVRYVTKAEALEIFREKHKNEPDLLESLRELGKNPLTPTLIISPRNIDTLDDLVASINNLDSSIIESRDFTDHKLLLEKINSITAKVSEAGIVISVIFIFTTLLVVYNSVRVAIYTHKKEIVIMKLVGASNWFISTPYLFSSLFYTLIGLSACVAIFFGFLTILQPYLEAFFIGYNINLISYFSVNFWKIFGLEFLAAAGINILASYIAVKKYSRI